MSGQRLKALICGVPVWSDDGEYWWVNSGSEALRVGIFCGYRWDKLVRLIKSKLGVENK